MRQAHSAPWGGKGRPRDRAPQVVIGVSMAAGKVWASQPQGGLNLGCGHALRPQLPRDPQIHDAPIRLRKTLPDVLSLIQCW